MSDRASTVEKILWIATFFVGGFLMLGSVRTVLEPLVRVYAPLVVRWASEAR